MNSHRNSDSANKFVLAGTLVVFGLIFNSVQSDTESKTDSMKDSLPDMTAREFMLTEAVNNMSPSLPVKNDDLTTLVDVFSDEQVLSYSYKVEVEDGDLDYDFFVAEMTPNLYSTICTNEDMKALNAIGTKYDYIYNSLDDTVIATIRIDPEKCAD